MWLVIAMPASVSALVSVASEKRALNKLLTVSPLRVVITASSLMSAKVALPLATGASLTAYTFSVNVAVGLLVPKPSVIV